LGLTPIGSTNYLPNKRHPIRGYTYIACATLCWGVSATLGRAAFTGRLFSEALRPIDPLILAQTRTTFSLFVLAPALLIARGATSIKIPRRDFLSCLALGVFGVAASNYFYYLAIQKTNVATAIILQYTAPVWVLFYMVGRRLQRATMERVASVLLAGLGIALVIGIVGGSKFKLDSVGLTAAILAAFSFAFYNVAGHGLLERYDRWRVLLYALLGAALCWIVINPPWKIVAAHYSSRQWLFLAIFSIASVLVPFSFYFAGLQHLDAVRAIVTSCLEPVFSIVIAALALGELIRPLQGLGIVLVLAATILVQLPGGDQSRPTIIEPME